jgi:hypothetical protein
MCIQYRKIDDASFENQCGSSTRDKKYNVIKS